MKMRVWEHKGQMWVEIGPSIGEENGLPAASFACSDNWLAQVRQLAFDWEGAVMARREVAAELARNQVNVKEGKI